MLMLNSKLVNAFGWGDCVMMGQRIVEHLNEDAELGNVKLGRKLQRRARALKIGKIIKRCKAETKALKKLDDEQKEYLERMRRRSFDQ
jgi:hypothetical protein